MIWAGAGDSHGQLSELHRQIAEALRWLTPEERAEKFTGHITLGRFKPGHHAAIPTLLDLTAKMAGRRFATGMRGQWKLFRAN